MFFLSILEILNSMPLTRFFRNVSDLIVSYLRHFLALPELPERATVAFGSLLFFKPVPDLFDDNNYWG